MRYLTIFILIISTLSGVLGAQEADVTATAYQTVNVRSGPGTQYDVIGQLAEGDVVPVLGRDSSATRWLAIAMPVSEDRGWVAVFTVTTSGGLEALPIVDLLTDADEDPDQVNPDDGVQVVAFGRVNVRSGPGITFPVVSQLEIETEAEATARSNYNSDWLYVENDDVAGWVAYFTVTVRGDVGDLPVLVPDAASGDLVPPSTQIQASFNVRLHSRPSFGSPVTGVIPFETIVSPIGVSPNGTWLYVAAEDAEGWAWTRLFEITDEQLSEIPRRAVPTAVPTPFALATSTPAPAGEPD